MNYTSAQILELTKELNETSDVSPVWKEKFAKLIVDHMDAQASLSMAVSAIEEIDDDLSELVADMEEEDDNCNCGPDPEEHLHCDCDEDDCEYVEGNELIGCHECEDDDCICDETGCDEECPNCGSTDIQFDPEINLDAKVQQMQDQITYLNNSDTAMREELNALKEVIKKGLTLDINAVKAPVDDSVEMTVATPQQLILIEKIEALVDEVNTLKLELQRLQ